MVRLEGISKSFGDKTVLDNFSLEIGEGERFVLLGRSGCGKTTLLRLIAGFEQPDAGSITIKGTPVTGMPIEKRPIGFIFQRHALFPHKTVYENIAVGPRVRGEAEAEIDNKIGELLEMIKLTDLRNAWPNQLSGGESQRVALARAVINRPQVLLLDEPLSALDASLRQNLRDELIEIQKTFGITFLFVTHDQEEAMSLADRMSVLEGGSLLQVGTPQELYDRPADSFVARFLGELNRLNGEVKEEANQKFIVSLAGGGQVEGVTEKNFKKGNRVEVCVRPEKIQLTREENRAAGWNALRGVIEHKSFFGSRIRYRVKLGDGQSLNVETQHGNEGQWKDGDALWARFLMTDARIFDGVLHV